MHIRQRFTDEDGGVLVIAAIVLPLLLLVSAVGVGSFSLYASHRELQRAADQAALSGAAVLPPFDPNVLVDNAPFPLPDTEPVYQLADATTGQNLPRMRDLVPDPRAVACTVGSDSLSSATSATVVNAFGDALTQPPLGDDGNPIQTVCSDPRVDPVMEPNPDNTTPVQCADRLVQHVAGQAGVLNIDALKPVTSLIQTEVNTVVEMPLNHVLPAAFTPRMRVTAYSKLHPPLVSFITGKDSGTTHATSVAYRRIKNAVIVPIFPVQQKLVELGQLDTRSVITAPDNLNTALHTSQKPLIDAITDADNRLDALMVSQGLPCQHLLHNLRQDLSDIYDPPTGPAPSAFDIVDSAVTAAQNVASLTGQPAPDPTNPNSLAGEAFMVIGVSVTDLMQPVAATQIPILDVALVSMTRAANGNFQAAAIDAANAHGAFRATLAE